VTLILAAGFDWVTEAESWVAFATLLAMEIVLGIDNVVFISILGGLTAAWPRAAGAHHWTDVSHGDPGSSIVLRLLGEPSGDAFVRIV
jgi:hypothetical protein